MRLSLSLLLLALSACSSPPPPPASPASGEVAPASSSAPPAVASSAPESTAEGPVKQSGIGGPCPAGPPAYPFLLRHCDANGKVTGVSMPVDVLHGVPPAGAQILRQDRQMDNPPGQEVVIAAEGNRLWIKVVTCGHCRRVIGWSFVGDLPLLRDDEIRGLQTELGLPADPVLKTPDAWKTVLATTAPKPRSHRGR